MSKEQNLAIGEASSQRYGHFAWGPLPLGGAGDEVLGQEPLAQADDR